MFVDNPWFIMGIIHIITDENTEKLYSEPSRFESVYNNRGGRFHCVDLSDSDR